MWYKTPWDHCMPKLVLFLFHIFLLSMIVLEGIFFLFIVDSL